MTNAPFALDRREFIALAGCFRYAKSEHIAE